MSWFITFSHGGEHDHYVESQEEQSDARAAEHGEGRTPQPHHRGNGAVPKQRGRKLLPRHPVIVETTGADQTPHTFDVLDNNALMSLNNLQSVANLGDVFSVDKCYHATKFSSLIKKRTELVGMPCISISV